MSNSPNIPSDNSGERLPRSLVLSHRGWVKNLFESGTRYHHRLLSLIALTKPNPCEIEGQAAFFTPKKIGQAHVRNKIRRHMKEAYRKDLQHLHSSQLWIWLAKPAASRSSFDDIQNAMVFLSQKAIKSSRNKTNS